MNYNDVPIILKDFLINIDTIKAQSKNTSKSYFYDLRSFMRFINMRKKNIPENLFDEIDITDITLDDLNDISLSDLYDYMSFLNSNKKNSPSSRARKVSSLKNFYKYLCDKKCLISNNPTINLDSPKIGKRMPKYLNLDESLKFLDSIDNQRDYCIFTLLLNCGLRVSELVNINLNDLTNEELYIIGKGNKERTIYLNDACKNSINTYLQSRPHNGAKDKNALFLNKNGYRLGVRSVQMLVKKYLKLAGINSEKYSTHKLRHTAATLMYKHGKVDVLALQQILGHSNLSTTQIYTHTDNEILKDAMKSNPLSNKSKN